MTLFDDNSAYGFMEKLVKEIGNRESGTNSERRAAEKIKKWFEEFELADARIEEFEIKTSRILKEQAFLVDGTRLQCAAVGNSQSTSPEGVEGEVVMLESTSQEALERVRNKIAVLNIVLYKNDFLKVVGAGPLALIYPSAGPFTPNIFRSIRAEYVENQNIPAITLAHDDALDLLVHRKRIKIITEVKRITAKSQNVTGELPGRLETEDILVGGHYDTVRTVVGAHDNAAGTAIVLELARIFAHEKLERTLKFAAFGSEEAGLRGSSHFAEHPENTKPLRFYFNFDVHGILLGPLTATVFGSEDLKLLLRFISKDLGIPLQITSELVPGSSDHMPLSFHGVPSIWLSRRGGATQLMHTNLEDLRWCGPDAFGPAGKLSQTLLERLLKAEELPFEKDIPIEISKALERRFSDMGVRRSKAVA